MDHTVDAVERVCGELAHVSLDELDPAVIGRERAFAPIQPIEETQLVATLEQPTGEDASDIARPTGDQDGTHLLRGTGWQPIRPTLDYAIYTGHRKNQRRRPRVSCSKADARSPRWSTMERLHTTLDGPVLVRPVIHADARGFFHESYRRNAYSELGVPEEFVQDNHSRSGHGI